MTMCGISNKNILFCLQFAKKNNASQYHQYYVHRKLSKRIIKKHSVYFLHNVSITLLENTIDQISLRRTVYI